jgi:hypothetical protein
VIRIRSAALGLCLLLAAACGQKFAAGGDAAGAGGELARAGAPADAGAAGDSAGTGDSGGTDGLAGGAGAHSGGASGGGVAGTESMGGAATAGAAGGPPLDPPIPVKGLALWLRADLGVLPKEGPVALWEDQSGNQMNATQSAMNVRPKFVAADGMGSKPTISFSAGQFLTMPPGFADFSLGLTGFMVVKPSDSKCASMIELSNGSEKDDIALSFSDGAWGYEVFTDFNSGGMVSTSAPSLYAVVQRPTGAVDLRVNSNLVFQKSYMAPGMVARQENFVGNTLYANCTAYQGQISEIILYQRFVTENELVKIETYLQQHWSLPVGPTPMPQQ